MNGDIINFFEAHPNLVQYKQVLASKGRKTLRDIERESIANKIIQTDNKELIEAAGLVRRKMHAQIIEGVKDHIEIQQECATLVQIAYKIDQNDQVKIAAKVDELVKIQVEKVSHKW